MRNNKFLTITLTGNYMSIVLLDCGITLSIDNQNNIIIEVRLLYIFYKKSYRNTLKVPSAIAGGFRGLCGTPNGDPSDDLMKPNESLANSTIDFSNSWKNPSSTVICTPLTCSKDSTELAHHICTNIP